MELGGNGPIVVLDDADRERTVAAIGSAAFFNAGQSCAAAERIMASDAGPRLAGRGPRRVRRDDPAGRPPRAGHHDGPGQQRGSGGQDGCPHRRRARARRRRRVRRRPAERRADDACTTSRPCSPNVPDGAAVTREETFGPIAPVSAFSDDRALLAAANASSSGLSSAVFTRDLDRAFWFAERLQTGQVTVNDTSNYWELHLPFGGWAGKSSGRGRVGGRHIFEAMTQIRSVAFDVGRRDGMTNSIDDGARREVDDPGGRARPTTSRPIGEGIRRERLRRGLTLAQLAAAGQPDRQRVEPDRARRIGSVDQLVAPDQRSLSTSRCSSSSSATLQREIVVRKDRRTKLTFVDRAARIRAGLGRHLRRIRGAVARDHAGRRHGSGGQQPPQRGMRGRDLRAKSSPRSTARPTSLAPATASRSIGSCCTASSTIRAPTRRS